MLTPKYAGFDLAHLARMTGSLFDIEARSRKIDFSIEIAERLWVEADPELLQRVLLNLLSNAFKFVPGGGAVTLGLAPARDGFELRVQDTGPGVPESMRAAIFDRFRQVEESATRRFGGTGLGLAIAKELVGLHRGTIHEEEAPGGGALFIVRVPVKAPMGTRLVPAPVELGGGAAAQAAVQDAGERLRAPVARGADGSDNGSPSGIANGSPTGTSTDRSVAGRERGVVLVVEDNPDMNRFIVESLSPEFSVIAAADGVEGLDAARKHRPDLILSDIMMPRMSGDQLVRAIRAEPELEGVPIVLLSAKADEQLKLRLLREGAQDYVMKPFSVDELRLRTRNLVAVRRARALLREELATKTLDLEALAREVTARRRERESAIAEMRAARDEAERMLRLRDEFISTVAHELKTPLSPLKLQSQLATRMLARGGLPSGKAYENFVAMSERQIERLSQLIESLLDVSRIRLGRFVLLVEEVNLSAVVAGVLEHSRASLEAAECPVELHAESGVIGHWDAIRLAQVVTNLLTNAMKFGRKKPIRIFVTSEGERAKLVVQDLGIGIAEGEQPRLFERFERAVSVQSYEGMGLGLYVARQIVLAHHGTIEVKSAPGEGATFTVELPKAVLRHEGASPTSESA